MNSKRYTLVVFASWEDRFRLGVEVDLNEAHYTRVIVFYFTRYSDKTREERSFVKKLCKTKSLEYQEIELHLDFPGENLVRMARVIDSLDPCHAIVVDISTMPREIIWQTFWLCEGRNTNFGYRYHSPAKYSGKWLSRNFGRPRLVHKLSGIARSGTPTVLLLVAGYDVQRAWQLFNFFEPSKFIIGLQTKSKFANNEENMQQYVQEFSKIDGFSCFEMNAFGDDHGLNCIQQQLNAIGEGYNIICSSLGPKLTAVSLYCAQRQCERLGLVYAPASEFSDEYSEGIDASYKGVLGGEKNA